MPRGRDIAGVARPRRLFLLLFCAGLWPCAPALAQRPPLEVPATPAAVVERLPHGYAALVPDAETSPLQAAAQLLGTAAATGDARLAARAESMLARFPANTGRADVLALRAFAAQHRHDFAGATRLLEQEVRLQPRDAQARYSLAQVHLVQGRLDLARNDCAALALGVDAQTGWLCLAALSLRRGDFAQAARSADQWLDRPDADPGLRRHVDVLRGEIAARNGDPKADAWFRRALALAPRDVRTLSAYARFLRGAGRNAEVVALVGAEPATDTLALQQALAARALGDPRAAAMADALGRRFARAHAVGATPELRDEAEYLLTLRHEARPALALALRNFAAQRDREDVDLLVRAAMAARRPQALDDAARWARSQGLRLDGGGAR